MGPPQGLSGKESPCQWRRHKKLRLNTWVGKIPWRRKWQPTPVFLPGESSGQRSLAGYSSQGRKELDTIENTHIINYSGFYSYNGIVHSNETAWFFATYNNVDASQNIMVRKKKRQIQQNTYWKISFVKGTRTAKANLCYHKFSERSPLECITGAFNLPATFRVLNCVLVTWVCSIYDNWKFSDL